MSKGKRGMSSLNEDEDDHSPPLKEIITEMQKNEEETSATKRVNNGGVEREDTHRKEGTKLELPYTAISEDKPPFPVIPENNLLGVFPYDLQILGPREDPTIWRDRLEGFKQEEEKLGEEVFQKELLFIPELDLNSINDPAVYKANSLELPLINSPKLDIIIHENEPQPSRKTCTSFSLAIDDYASSLVDTRCTLFTDIFDN